jgi:hypothetical protein
VAVTGAFLVGRLADRPVSTQFPSASVVPWLLLLLMGAAIVVLGFLATARRARESARMAMAEMD